MRWTTSLLVTFLLSNSACIDGSAGSDTSPPGGKGDSLNCPVAAWDEHGICRQPNGQFAPSACCPSATEVSCTLEPTTDISASAAVTATLSWTAEGEAFADSDGSVELFGRAYSFTMGVVDGDFSVFFFENIQVQDEVGDIACDVPAKAGERFCEEPITIDVGGPEGPDNIHALDFWCEVGPR